MTRWGNFFGKNPADDKERREAEKEEIMRTQREILARRRNKGERAAYFREVSARRRLSEEQQKVWSFQTDQVSQCYIGIHAIVLRV